jgi:hypothetical protein
VGARRRQLLPRRSATRTAAPRAGCTAPGNDWHLAWGGVVPVVPVLLSPPAAAAAGAWAREQGARGQAAADPAPAPRSWCWCWPARTPSWCGGWARPRPPASSPTLASTTTWTAT